MTLSSNTSEIAPLVWVVSLFVLKVSTICMDILLSETNRQNRWRKCAQKAACNKTDSQNGLCWRGLTNHLAPNPCHGQGHLIQAKDLAFSILELAGVHSGTPLKPIKVPLEDNSSPQQDVSLTTSWYHLWTALNHTAHVTKMFNGTLPIPTQRNNTVNHVDAELLTTTECSYPEIFLTS